MPTSMTMNDLISPAQQGSTLPIQHGMELAQKAAQTEQLQAQTQNMQQQLDTGKWNSFTSRMGNFMNAAPAIQKAMKPGMKDWMQQQGYDPAIIDATNDEDYQRQIKAALDWNSRNPIDASTGLRALGSVNDFGGAIGGAMTERSKEQQAADMKAASLANAQTVAGIGAQGKVDAAVAGAAARNGPNSPQAARVQNQVNNSYQSTMKGWESALQSADMLKRTMNDVDLGELNSSKNVRSELNAKVASLLAGGKPGTVYGTQSVEQDSLYQNMMDHVNKVMGESNSTITQPQWEQLKKEINSFTQTNAKMHDDAYQSFREGVSPNYQPAIDARFNKFRQSKGLPVMGGQTAAAAPDAGGSPDAKLSANQQNFIQHAQTLKKKDGTAYSMDEITSMMNQAGVK